MKKVMYSRCSTTKQEMSCEIQLEEVESKFGKMDLVFSDFGVSGASPIDKRKSLLEMIDVLRKGDEVYVYSLSRIARDTLQSLFIEKEILKTGAVIKSVKEEIDDTPESILLRQICMCFSQYEREMIRSRVRSARKTYRNQNKFCGGKREYGYKVIDGQLVKDTEEQKVISMIRDWRKEGDKITTIQKKLNDNNIPSSTGMMWHYQSVRNLVKRVA